MVGKKWKINKYYGLKEKEEKKCIKYIKSGMKENHNKNQKGVQKQKQLYKLLKN